MNRKIAVALGLVGIFLSYFLTLTIPAGFSSPVDLQKVKRLQWIDPLGREPMSYRTFKAQEPEPSPLKIELIQEAYVSGEPKADSLISIIVNSTLYPKISGSLLQYRNDIIADGYLVEVVSWSGGSPVDLRTYLKNKLASGLRGAVLIGDLPVAWFEMNVWGEEEFPCDLYFMDLDGTWTDSNNNGLFDQHTAGTGDVGPEIWVGRIVASRQTWGGEVQLIENYFAKNHAYRTQTLSLPNRALSYVDDDWYYFGNCDLDLAYSDITTVTSYNTTIATDYKQRLTQGYEWVHLCSHSSCWAHTFMINGGQGGGGTVYNYEIQALDPHGFFYNLFACSNTRFIETNNQGNWYIFVDTYGLTAVGSTKTGSMLDFASFYGPIGQRKCIGQAFKEWFNVQAQGGFDPYEKAWYYGMNILGDPALTIFNPNNRTEEGGSSGEGEEGGTSSWTIYKVTANTFSDGSPSITTDGSGKVWVTWETGRDVRSNIYNSYFNGSTWSPESPVNIYEYWDVHPAMTKDSAGRPWVTWQSLRDPSGDLNFNVMASYYNGTNWVTPMFVTTGADYDLEPAIATDKTGKVWVIWKSWRDCDANIYASYYNGSSWSPATGLTDGLEEDTDPTVAVDNSGNVWVAWSTNKEGDWNVYSRYYNGSTWSQTMQVTTDTLDDLNPSMGVAASGRIWIVYQGWAAGNADIYASYYTGSGWSTPVAITSDPKNDLCTAIATLPSGNVWASWMSKKDGNWNIYASYYEGTGWSTPEPVTLDSHNDFDPAMGVDNSGNVWVAWATDRDGDWNIYAGFRPETIPPVSITLIPDVTTVPRGGTLGITIMVTNNTGENQTFEAWTEAFLPNGNPYPGNPVLDPRTVTLSPHQTRTKHVSHKVPKNAPLGTYKYCGKVGTYPTPVMDEDCFNFTVTP